MDELAERVEYSKATLYHHFTSKEDLMLAVIVDHVRKRTEYFTRAALFRGGTRERMFGFGIADRLLSRLYPLSFPLAQLVMSPSIWSKCSEARQKTYSEASGKCFELAIGVAEDGKQRGDFTEWSPNPEQIVWGLISISKGAHLLAEEDMFSGQLEDEFDSMSFLFDNYHYYLDGLVWQPFSRDHDYSQTEKRMIEELFSDEFSQLES